MELTKNFANEVKRNIIFTNHKKIPKSVDLQFLIDIGLSILGKPLKTFKEYEENVRKEYSFFSQEDYALGRIFVLQKFMNRKNIYSTKFFRDKYESQAQKTLDIL